MDETTTQELLKECRRFLFWLATARNAKPAFMRRRHLEKLELAARRFSDRHREWKDSNPHERQRDVVREAGADDARVQALAVRSCLTAFLAEPWRRQLVGTGVVEENPMRSAWDVIEEACHLLDQQQVRARVEEELEARRDQKTKRLSQSQETLISVVREKGERIAPCEEGWSCHKLMKSKAIREAQRRLRRADGTYRNELSKMRNLQEDNLRVTVDRDTMHLCERA